MGSICACQRDHTDPPSGPSPLPVPELYAKLSESQDIHSDDTDLETSPASPTSIFHLAGPITSYYKFVRETGVVGRADCFLAEYVGTKQRCIVKLISKDSFRLAEKIKHFRSLLMLDHPNVLKTNEISQDDTHIYVIFEAGERLLSQYLSANVYLPENMASMAIRQLASGLAHCHSRGVVHKELSLDTIVLASKPKRGKITVKIGGFERFDTAFPTNTSAFTAPEIIETGNYSEKSDIWSLGVILYTILSGECPFERGELHWLLWKELSFPTERWGSIDRQATLLISSMLARDPAQRPTAQQCLAHPWLSRHTSLLSVQSEPVLQCSRPTPRLSSLKAAIVILVITGVGKVDEAIEVFDEIDRDRDGVVSRGDMREWFESTLGGERMFTESLLSAMDEGESLSKESLRAVISWLNEGGSDTVCVEEISRLVIGAQQCMERTEEIDNNGLGTFEQLLRQAVSRME